MPVRCYLSEAILSVTTGSLSFFSRSHMWMLEAASSTQKTVGLVWAHCRETTGSAAVPFFHSATGCSWLTACSLMLPSPQPTWNKGREKRFQKRLYSILLLWLFLCVLVAVAEHTKASILFLAFAVMSIKFTLAQIIAIHRMESKQTEKLKQFLCFCAQY